MKRNLLFGLLLLAGTSFGQMVIESDLLMEGESTSTLVGKNFSVFNTGTEEVQFYWDIVRSDGMPEEWQFSICDAFFCFGLGKEILGCDDDVNIMAGGSEISYFKVGVNPNNIAGNHSVTFRLLDVCENATAANVLAEQVVNFSITGSSSTNEVINSDLVIYPNPAFASFQIKNDKDVKSINILNIVGKSVFVAPHQAGEAHDISLLDNGFYLVRMLDRKENAIKVIRLTKE